MKTTIKTKELKAVLFAASKDECRYVLNGVCIELKSGGKPIITATNGRFLISIESDSIESKTDATFIIPRLFAAEIVRVAEMKNAEEVSIVNTAKTCFVRIGGMSKKRIPFGKKFKTILSPNKEVVILSSPLIEGNFPNWRQVIPSKFDGVKKYALAPRLLERIMRAAVCLHKENALVFNFSDDLSACVINAGYSKNFQAVLMPMRVS